MKQPRSGAPGSRPVAPDPAVIEWLWSKEGLAWHKAKVRRVQHGLGWFAEIKKDHECSVHSPDCTFGYSPYADELIQVDLHRYGISGVPQEWKERLGRWSV